MTFDSPLLLEEQKDRQWRLARILGFQGRTQRFDIQEGFVTDLASVPRLLQWFIPPNGTYTRAAVLHDLLWRLSRLYWGKQNLPDTITLYGSAYPLSYVLDPWDVDGLFRRAMRLLGTGFCVRWLMWWAVRFASILTGYKGSMGVREWVQFIAVPAVPASTVVGCWVAVQSFQPYSLIYG